MRKRKYLKIEEMQQIELYAKEQQLIDKDILLRKQEIENLKVQIEKKNLEIQNLVNEKNKKREMLKAYYEKLRKTCKIKSKNWGYDPESGEIMEDK